MSELQTVISYLNQHPFQQNLTLVSFDNKNTNELLELLIIVVYEIDPSQKDYLDYDIDSNELITNLLNCLKLLNYPTIREDETVFMQQFKNEEKRDLICNILYWLLTKQRELKTRAYIAKYLKPFELPQEFLVDPILFDLLEELKKRKVEFKNSHKQLMETTGNSNIINDENDNVNMLQQEITQLKHEKEQLISKLGKMKNKSEEESLRFAAGKNQNTFSELLELTSFLRRAQEEEAMLFERGSEQRKELNINSKYIANLINKKNNLQSIIESNDILNGLKNEINATNFVLNKLDEEYAENEQVLNETLLILNGQNIYTENDVINLANNINILEKEVSDLEKGRDELLQTIDSKLGFYKKRAIGVTKKKTDAIKRLNERKNELRDLRSDAIKLDEEMDKIATKNGGRVMRENELKKYMNSLRIKTEKYKKCKTKLQNLRNELSVFQTTNERLREKHSNLAEYLEIKEINNKRNELHNVAAIKNEGDIKKEIEKINQTLKLKKNKLQPIVKKLKEKRDDFKLFENKYLEKKKIYQNMRISTDSELNKLENNISSLKKNVNSLETKHESIKSEIEINKIRLEKVEMEEKYQNNLDELNKEFKSFRDLYDEEINKLLHLSKSLINKQKEIKEKHQNNIKQREYFIQLKELLQFKLNIVQNRVNEMEMLNIDNVNNEDRLVLVD